MKKLTKFLYVTMLELSVVGIVLLIIGLKSGADSNLIVNAIQDKCILFFQWIMKLV